MLGYNIACIMCAESTSIVYDDGMAPGLSHDATLTRVRAAVLRSLGWVGARSLYRWVHECAAGKDGVVLARGGEYVLRYRSAKREMQLVSVS